MKNSNKLLYFLLSINLFLFFNACKSNKQWEGQGEIKKIVTKTVPVAKQYKGTFNVGEDIYISNDFAGARINGANLLNDSLVGILITPENTPINPSPWYSFKIWSKSPKRINLKLFYPEGVNHRYYPNISNDGMHWKKMDSVNISLVNKDEDLVESSKSAILNLEISKDTTWISAQEIAASSQVTAWSKKLEANSFVTKSQIGKSHQGRPINLLKIGESDDQAMVVVLSRQHPPEVTGYLAMKAFVETILENTETAREFRSQYNTYVIPLANPDGAANGHWRHNAGGIDLNRDWADFNQPETAAIRDFFEKKVEESGGNIYFFVDFHSTWQDIYYTIASESKGNMPGLVPELISLTAMELKNYKPNIKPSPSKGRQITSTSYFFKKFGAESLTYEIGDNTPDEFIELKGKITARKLMELMINR